MVKDKLENVLVPIEEKLAGLSVTVESLATKEDLQKFLITLEEKFTEQLIERDRKIFELEEKVILLTEQREGDIELAKRLNDKITNLEKNLVESESKLRHQLDNLVANETDDDSDDDSDDDDTGSLKQPLDFLLIGDSICKHINVDLVNPGGQNKLICRPGAKIPEIREALKSIKTQYAIDKVALHIATNHVPDESPREVAKKVIDFIDEIKINMPKSQLFVSLVLPKYNNSWLEGINCINQQIFDASLRMGFKVIQHPYFSNGGQISDTLLARDMIHLSRLGVKQFGVDLKHSLRNR